MALHRILIQGIRLIYDQTSEKNRKLKEKKEGGKKNWRISRGVMLGRDGNQVASNCSGGLFPEGKRKEEKNMVKKKMSRMTTGEMKDGRNPIFFLLSYSSF